MLYIDITRSRRNLIINFENDKYENKIKGLIKEVKLIYENRFRTPTITLRQIFTQSFFMHEVTIEFYRTII